MIELPNIPTDSIYKFYFVSGILLCLVSIFLSYNVLLKGYTQLHDTDSIGSNRVNLEKINIKKQQRRIAILDTELKLWHEVFKEKHWKEPNHENLSKTDSLKSLEKKLANNQIYSKDDSLTDIDLAKIDQIGRNGKLLSKQYSSIKGMLLFCMIVGSILIVYGSYMWTEKIQKPQDKILAMQVRLLEKQLNEPIKSPKRFPSEPKPQPRKMWRNNN